MRWNRKAATAEPELTEPDIRPLVRMVYGEFRKSGVPPVLAARVAVGLVINSLYGLEQLTLMDNMIRSRVEIFDDLIDCCGRLVRRMRIVSAVSVVCWLAIAAIYFFDAWWSFLHHR